MRTLYPHELSDRSVTGGAEARSLGEDIFAAHWTQLPCVRYEEDFDSLANGTYGVGLEELLAQIGDEVSRSDAERAAEAEMSESAPSWLKIADTWWETGWHKKLQTKEPSPLGVLEPLILGCIDQLFKEVSALGVVESTGENLWKLLVSQVPDVRLNNTVGLSIAKQCIENSSNDEQSAIVQLQTRQGATTFFREYPVLWRTSFVVLDNWRRFFGEILEIVLQHRRELAKFVFPKNDTTSEKLLISNLEFGQGDSHNHGRSVVKIHLRLGGETAEIFFKPHPFNNGGLWKEILEVAGLDSDDIATTETLDLDERGYFEKRIDSQDISNPALVARRLGKLTAVLHVIQANDMHHENVAFVNDRPCLLDMETLLHPVRQAEPRESSQGDIGLQMYEDSVLNIGILPSPSVYSDNGETRRLDISVMGVIDEQRGGVRAPQVVQGEDGLEVRYEWGQFRFEDDVHRRGELISHPFEFLEGFEETYGSLLENKHLIIDAIFGNGSATFRRITRPTAVYGKLLTEFSHPDFSRSGVAQSLVHGKLLARFRGEPNRLELLHRELVSMRMGDVPHFTFTVGPDCENSDEMYQSLVSSIDRLGQADLFRQKLLILYSFVCGGTEDSGVPDYVDKLTSEFVPLDGKSLVELLDKVSTFGPNGSCSFFDLVAPSSEIWLPTPATFDLYSGLAGVGIALAGLQQFDSLSGGARWRSQISKLAGVAAKEFADTLTLGKKEASFSDADPSLFGPLGGCYLLLATDPDADRSWLPQLEKVLVIAATNSGNLDMVSGVAGSLQLALLAGASDKSVAAIALHLCELVEERYGLGVGDIAKQPGPNQLVGLSHGITGALLVLDRTRRRAQKGCLDLDAEFVSRIDALIGSGLNWEYSVVSSHGNSWPDYRAEENFADAGAPGSMNAWCHGAFGALVCWGEISSEGAAKSLNTEQVNELLTVARRIAREQIDQDFGNGFGALNESLCHGNIGNLLCFSEDLSRRQDDDEDLKWFSMRANQLLMWFDSNFPRCGGIGNVPIMGLYMGLTGIVYGVSLLRARLHGLLTYSSDWSAKCIEPVFDPITLSLFGGEGSVCDKTSPTA